MKARGEVDVKHLFRKCLVCAGNLCLKSRGSHVMIGRGFVDCLDPTAVLCFVL